MTVEYVYVLHHVYELHIDGREPQEEVKFIGVYSSEQLANAAIERLAGQPGFRKYPDCFSVNRYELDQDNWTEGFTTWDPVLADDIPE